MDPIFWAVVLVLVVRRVVVDGAYAMRGATPPSYELRMAKFRAKGGKRPGRYGSRDYVRDLWHDAIEDARETRIAKRVEAKQAKAGRANPAPAQPVAPVPVMPAPVAKPAPAPPAPVPATPPAPTGANGVRPVPSAPQTPAQPVPPAEPKSPAPAPRPAAVGDERPLAPVTELYPNKEAPRMTASTMTGQPTGEVTGLASAQQYARQMAAAFNGAASSVETYTAALTSKEFGVSGEAVTAAAEAAEAQQAAAVAWARVDRALAAQNSVAESYSANPGAGTREFVTSE